MNDIDYLATRTENGSMKPNHLRFRSLFAVDNVLGVKAAVLGVPTADWLAGQLADDGVYFRHCRWCWKVLKRELAVGGLLYLGAPILGLWRVLDGRTEAYGFY